MPVAGDSAHGSTSGSRSNTILADPHYKRSSRASDTSSSIYSGEGDIANHDSSLIDSDDDADYGAESVSIIVGSLCLSLILYLMVKGCSVRSLGYKLSSLMTMLPYWEIG